MPRDPLLPIDFWIWNNLICDSWICWYILQLGYHFTLQVWLVFFLFCLSTCFESLPQGLQEISKPFGLKFLQVLGQMTPWARNDPLRWPPEVNLGPPDPLRIIIVPKNTSKNLLKSGGPCSQQCTITNRPGSGWDGHFCPKSSKHCQRHNGPRVLTL